jgi:hypothetical protein
MKPRDIFRIIVATVGLLGFGYGLIYLTEGVIFAMGSYSVSHSQAGVYAVRGAVEMVFGILFMKGFPPFVDMAFPPEQPPPIPGTEETKHDV